MWYIYIEVNNKLVGGSLAGDRQPRLFFNCLTGDQFRKFKAWIGMQSSLDGQVTMLCGPAEI